LFFEKQIDLVNSILDLKKRPFKIIEYLSKNTPDSLYSFDDFLDTEHETQNIDELNNQRIFLLNTFIL
jgi:hypothetical protein